MTISNSTVQGQLRRERRTTNFSFGFEIEVNTYLEVYLTDAAGVETLADARQLTTQLMMLVRWQVATSTWSHLPRPARP